ncbi:hypothetical protein UB46_29425 [Burkholderiaceae bacterium 16]|nr:hypothetical protein UB46_29425 [Burkholderiaceae bacterium 16]
MDKRRGRKHRKHDVGQAQRIWPDFQPDPLDESSDPSIALRALLRMITADLIVHAASQPTKAAAMARIQAALGNPLVDITAMYETFMETTDGEWAGSLRSKRIAWLTEWASLERAYCIRGGPGAIYVREFPPEGISEP